MNLLTLPISAALTGFVGSSMRFVSRPLTLSIQANFLYGSGGTTMNCWVQSSIDLGATWFDIANFSLTTAAAIRQFNLTGITPKTTIVTPTSGTLAANTANDGIFGNMFRTLTTTTGTYAGATSLSIDLGVDLA